MKLCYRLVAAMVSCGRLSVREKEMWWDLAQLGEFRRVGPCRTMSDHVLSIDIGDEVLKGKLVMSSVSGLLYLLWDPLS